MQERPMSDTAKHGLEMLKNEISRLYCGWEREIAAKEGVAPKKRCEYCRMAEAHAQTLTLASVYHFPMTYCPACKRKLCHKKGDC